MANAIARGNLAIAVDAPLNLPGDEPSKAIRKLADVAELLITPWSTRMQARAEAYRIETITSAQIEAAELVERARMSADARMIRHQINKEAILRMAAEEQDELPDAGDSGPIDRDWLSKFAFFAQDTSDAQIQRLWAKILAGEISQPGRFSIRLLNILHTITQTEANQFCSFCQTVWHSLDGAFAYQLYSRKTDELLADTYSIDVSVYSALRETGLVEASSTTAIMLEKYPPGPPLDVRFGQRKFRVTSDHGNSLGIRARVLTGPGRQLSDLCEISHNEDYLRCIQQYSEHISFTPIDVVDVVHSVPPRHAFVLNE